MEPVIGGLRGPSDGSSRRIGPKSPIPRGAALLGLVVVAAVAIGVARDRATSPGAGGPRLRIVAAVVSEGEQEAAGYLTVVNDGGADQLVAVDSDAADDVSIHRSEKRAGVVVMVAEPSVGVAANASTELRPGATHLMLEGLRRPLRPGDEIDIVLSFGRSGPMTVRASVWSYSQIARSIDSAPAVRSGEP